MFRGEEYSKLLEYASNATMNKREQRVTPKYRESKRKKKRNITR